MRISNNNAVAVLSTTVENGGGTYNPDGTMADVSTGYALSLHPEWTKVVDLDDVTPTTVAVYFHDFAQAGKFVGTWVHEGQVHFDVVDIEQDYDIAMHLAVMAQQDAIYDLEKGEELFTSSYVDDYNDDFPESLEWGDLPWGSDDWDQGQYDEDLWNEY